MKQSNCRRTTLLWLGVVVCFSLAVVPIQAVNAAESEGIQPIADAGLPRYVAKDPVRLDGGRSYDSDNSGPLSYAWTQLSGPPLVITGADTATPAVSGFVQTEAIQECELELVVNDGQSASVADTVNIVIVPDFGPITLQQQNPPFDPNKPTVFYFSGGDSVNGFANEQPWGNAAWLEKANIINFPAGYTPDVSYEDYRTYYHMGDMIIVFLSKVAPNYEQPIQIIGWSTGGQPAIDAGIRLNRVYKDRRYAVNHVTELDAPCRWMSLWQGGIDIYLSSNALFLTSAVDGEPCWHDHYWGDVWPLLGDARQNLLGVWLVGYSHEGVRNWYRDSLTTDAANQFNHGVVAGAYWSVVGPGRNLQLASTPGAQTYTFKWVGPTANRRMDFFDELNHPGRLPEPVTLTGPGPGATADFNGVVLSCQPCENAVGYQLLSGVDPDHMVYLLSDTSSPPSDRVISFPFEQTWWTVRAYDRHGSTIYADPTHILARSVHPQLIQNSSTGQTYANIQQAINHAYEGDEVVLGAGTWRYLENLDFKGKSLTLRSSDPNDPNVVAATVVMGDPRAPVVTVSSGTGEPPTLNGLTITSSTMGVACQDAVPTLRNCVVQSPDGVAIEFWTGREPRLIGCTVVGQVKEVRDPHLLAHFKLDETGGSTARETISGSDDFVMGSPLWQPTGGQVDGALELDGIDDCIISTSGPNPAQGPLSVIVWIKGGAPGQVIISQPAGANWLLTDAGGKLMTELKGPGRSDGPLLSQTVITDGQWHRIALTWDGSHKTLCVDGVVVAQDTQSSLEACAGGLYIGVGKDYAANSFFSGLIDDVRIYNRAVRP
jgi:hypothetical protein